MQAKAGVSGARADPDMRSRRIDAQRPRPVCEIVVSKLRVDICRPEADVMSFPRAAANPFLEADVLPAAEQIERAERGGRIGMIENEVDRHSCGRAKRQPIRIMPACRRECRVELLLRADQDDVNWICRKAVCCACDSGNTVAAENRHARMNDQRQDHIGCESVGKQ